jgi:transcriptional regulator with XRE-family HTH domain
VSPSPDPIVEQLRKIRIEKKWSQRWVSELAGLSPGSQGHLSRVESGALHFVSLATVRRVADALGFDLVLVPKEPR